MMTLKLKVKINNLRSSLTITFLPCDFFLLAPLLLLDMLALFLLVWQRNEDLNIIKREESWLAIQHSLIPVLVDLIGQSDDVALAEAQLSLVFWLKVVQRFTARLLQGWQCTRGGTMMKMGGVRKNETRVGFILKLQDTEGLQQCQSQENFGTQQTLQL